jgi:hypothetical protein
MLNKLVCELTQSPSAAGTSSTTKKKSAADYGLRAGNNIPLIVPTYD